jgi:hypothetical protein
MIGAIALWFAETALGAALKSLWGHFFPPKTAQAVELSDAKTQLKDAENAKDISDKVDNESRADVNRDLDKWVRP